LLEAVAQAAVDAQAEAASAMAAHITSLDNAAKVIGFGTTLYKNTRVLVALSQAADQEPAVRRLFTELSERSTELLVALLDRLGLEASRTHAKMLRALFIGLSVSNLATGQADGAAKSEAVLDAVLGLLIAKSSNKPKRRLASQSKKS